VTKVTAARKPDRTRKHQPSKIARAAAAPTADDQVQRGASSVGRGKKHSPRQEAVARYTLAAAQKAPRVLFPQWLRTVLVVLLWLSSIPVYMQLVSPYVTYLSARTMGIGLAIFAGLAVHLWPTRTSPWRTVAWAATVTTLVGPVFLTLGWGRLGLALTTAIGFVIVILRVNQNGRKLVGLIRTWWLTR
jgi:hypothetical protein